ncbi:MAG: hypothetical protein IPL52_11615 [Flavobacteriales bacterium]|nr:hypothetical protein [Flavobacteriales bacterium]
MAGCDIIATNDSLTIIYIGDVTGASANLSVGMIRTDTLGNVAWARNYDINGSANEHVSQVIPTSFGYVMMGRTVAAPNQRSFLMGISFGGDLLWTRMYGAAGDVHIAPHTYLKGPIDMGDGYLFTGVRAPVLMTTCCSCEPMGTAWGLRHRVRSRGGNDRVADRTTTIPHRSSIRST